MPSFSLELTPTPLDGARWDEVANITSHYSADNDDQHASGHVHQEVYQQAVAKKNERGKAVAEEHKVSVAEVVDCRTFRADPEGGSGWAPAQSPSL
nr:hypothetical protein Iba_scaffold10327CG0050 [Ipomoea batatas]GME10641.1 hypothetical protein Iba_scaffold10328CG0200 [Ipomoea batatas]GME14245.1 hypothetical protein Iba_scaffold15101CG0040 [Ipomoea batatas]